MKQLSYFAVAVLGVLILASCSTSNNVVGGGIFQKRKYTGGVYWDRTQKIKSSGEQEEFDIYSIEEESQKKYVSSTTIYNEDVVSAESVVESDRTTNDDAPVAPVDEVTAGVKTVSTPVETSSEPSEVTISEKKNNFKPLKKQSAPAADVSTILLVILALIIPPLAVFLFEGATNRFWIDLILAILGWGVGFWLLGGLGWVCGLVAVIYALLIVLGVI